MRPATHIPLNPEGTMNEAQTMCKIHDMQKPCWICKAEHDEANDHACILVVIGDYPPFCPVCGEVSK